MRRLRHPLLPLSLLAAFSALRAADHDLVIYGGTSAAVAAAVQAKRLGKSVVIVCPDRHLGGLTSGGLGWTDSGNKAVVGGLAREFYHRVWLHYQKPEAWRQQQREQYGNRAQGHAASDGGERTMWVFEPHVAEQVFEDFVREHRIPVHRDEWLDRARGVRKAGGRIAAITMLSGRTFAGRMFLDATYEGDLMAAAGVSYHVGREAKRSTARSGTACRTGVLHHRHHFGVLPVRISPYRRAGRSEERVLPRVSAAPPGEFGEGDKRVQAYCFRMCLTTFPENRIPFPKPEGYDAAQYELLLRVYERRLARVLREVRSHSEHKTDTNNHGPFSTDNIGYNYDYPEASYERRREIIRSTRPTSRAGSTSSPTTRACPRRCRTRCAKWGLPKDEFTDNGHWSAPALHPRGAPHDRRLCDDRERAAQKEAHARLRRHGQLHHRFAQRAALHHPRRLRAERGRHRREHERSLRDRLRLAGAEKGPGRATCSCRSASRAPTSPTARSGWSRCS
jgi:hypothetical protein